MAKELLFGFLFVERTYVAMFLGCAIFILWYLANNRLERRMSDLCP